MNDIVAQDNDAIKLTDTKSALHFGISGLAYDTIKRLSFINGKLIKLVSKDDILFMKNNIKKEEEKLSSYYSNMTKKYDKVNTSLIDILKEQGWEEYKTPNYIYANGQSKFIHKDLAALDLETGKRFSVKKVELNFSSLEELVKESTSKNEYFNDEDGIRIITFPYNEELFIKESLNKINISTSSIGCVECGYENCCCGVFAHGYNNYNIEV